MSFLQKFRSSLKSWFGLSQRKAPANIIFDKNFILLFCLIIFFSIENFGQIQIFLIEEWDFGQIQESLGKSLHENKISIAQKNLWFFSFTKNINTRVIWRSEDLQGLELETLEIRKTSKHSWKTRYLFFFFCFSQLLCYFARDIFSFIRTLCVRKRHEKEISRSELYWKSLLKFFLWRNFLKKILSFFLLKNIKKVYRGIFFQFFGKMRKIYTIPTPEDLTGILNNIQIFASAFFRAWNFGF